jgi:hypothetical protein
LLRREASGAIKHGGGDEYRSSSLIYGGFPMRTVIRFIAMLAAALTTVVAFAATASAATAIEYGLIAAL